MKYAKIKDKEIPSVALGRWSWGVGINGGNQVFGNEYTDEDLRTVFGKAIRQGFTLWDTAAVYGLGASETILGKFIKGEKDIIISTKFTPLDGQEQSMRESLNLIIGVTKESHIDGAESAINIKLEQNEIVTLEKCAIDTGISIKSSWEKSMK